MGRSKVNRRSKKVRGGAKLSELEERTLKITGNYHGTIPIESELLVDGEKYIKKFTRIGKNVSGTNNTVSIATYNTSFASDLGLAIGSEKHFLSNDGKGNDSRQFFRNSIENAVEWCEETQKKTNDWGAIGFQEMNIPEKTGRAGDDVGIDYTFKRFTEGKEGKEDSKLKSLGLNAVAGALKFPFGFPCLLTIWNQSVFGELADASGSKSIYLAEMESAQSKEGYEGDTLVNENYQKGRPILIVLTKHNGKNYLLVNLHSPNRSPANAEKQIDLVKHYIKNHVKMAMAQFGIKNLPNEHCFIMGDYNGPLDKIMMSLEGEPEVSFSAFKEGDSVEDLPNSCCYNYNSSCPEELASGNVVKKLKLEPNVKYYLGTKEMNGYEWLEGAKITLTNDNFKQVKNEFLNDLLKKYKEYYKKEESESEGESKSESESKRESESESESQSEYEFDSNDLLEVSNNPIECVIVRSENKNRDESMGGKARPMNDRGKIGNYVLKGDMVLGANVAETAKMYPDPEPRLEQVSNKSDHEMVYVKFNLPETKGGSRTKRTKQLRKKRTKQLRKKRSKQLRKKRSQKLSRR